MPQETDPTRRDFLKQVAAATVAGGAVSPLIAAAQSQVAANAAAPSTSPWYRRALRWGQTNITEADVATYDIPWWRAHWKRTNVMGVIINAGGIVAYYPSKYPLHHRPPNLDGRDLFGELAKAAHEDGLSVLARMDSSKAFEPLYQAHPDWFAVNANGQPYRSGEFYLSCINSPYYTEWLPNIMREIVERSHPEGFTDNIWAGTERNSICYCKNCVEKFRAAKNFDLPRARNWDDPAFRQWIEWSYARRIEQWEFNNKVTREAGGKECIWIGMNGSGATGQGNSFRDLKEICARAEIIMLDNQSRTDNFGLQENAFAGKIIHSLLGYDKLIPESMAMYQHGRPQYRMSAKSAPEARMWMLSGFAGGIQPWWHHVGAYDEDRRPYQTAEPVMAWHKLNEEYLVNRKPIANVGVAWSQRNTDFFGRDNAEELVDQPFRGFIQALIRARIPYVPVHLDHLDRDADFLSVLILPNIGILSDAQIAAIRRFVQRGGSLIATGHTSLYDQWGDPRADFALGDLYGVKGGKPIAVRGGGGGAPRTAAADEHTYLRLTPELRAQPYGPKSGSEPAIASDAKRHPVLAGFDDTDILPFGSSIQALNVDSNARVLATFIPAFPTLPPEIVYMRTPRTDFPAIVVNEMTGGGGRVAFLPADLDRRFALNNFPDHGNLLANLVRWAARDNLPLDVQGPGLIDCELYQQANRLVLHLVNLTSAGTWRAPMHEMIPIGPIQVKIRLPKSFVPKTAKSLVSTDSLALNADTTWARLEVKSILDHEVVVLEG